MTGVKYTQTFVEILRNQAGIITSLCHVYNFPNEDKKDSK